MAITIDTTQLNDFATVLKQAFGEFKEESIPKSRVRKIYFVKRDQLRNTISSIRVVIPAGTKATPVPNGVAADKWKWVIDNLAAAEKWLKDELKKVPANAPVPAPDKNPYVDTKSAAKRYSRRQEAVKTLKKRLIDVYGEKKGKLRFKVYEKMAKDVGQSGSPSALWSFANGQTNEDIVARIAAKAAARSSGTTPEAAAAEVAATEAAAADAALVPATAQPTGIMGTLWPTDKPIYKRPAAIIGVAAVVGVVGWMVLSTPKKPTPPAKTEPTK
jgi:hypothetical protein